MAANAPRCFYRIEPSEVDYLLEVVLPTCIKLDCPFAVSRISGWYSVIIGYPAGVTWRAELQPTDPLLLQAMGVQQEATDKR